MVLLTCGIQYGKGVPLDAGVLTPSGYRKAGDIKDSAVVIYGTAGKEDFNILAELLSLEIEDIATN